MPRYIKYVRTCLLKPRYRQGSFSIPNSRGPVNVTVLTVTRVMSAVVLSAALVSREEDDGSASLLDLWSKVAPHLSVKTSVWSSAARRVLGDATKGVLGALQPRGTRTPTPTRPQTQSRWYTLDDLRGRREVSDRDLVGKLLHRELETCFEAPHRTLSRLEPYVTSTAEGFVELGVRVRSDAGRGFGRRHVVGFYNEPLSETILENDEVGVAGDRSDRLLDDSQFSISLSPKHPALLINTFPLSNPLALLNDPAFSAYTSGNGPQRRSMEAVNCVFKSYLRVRGSDRRIFVAVMAQANIKPGEVLSVDYGEHYWPWWLANAPERKHIHQETLKELRTKYPHLFFTAYNYIHISSYIYTLRGTLTRFLTAKRELHLLIRQQEI